MTIQYKKIIGMLLLINSLVFAQFPGDGPRRRPLMRERHEKIEKLRIWKMTEFLDLTTEQAGKFFPALKELDEKTSDLFDKRYKLMDDILEKSKQKEYNPSDKELEKILKKLDQYDKKIKEIKMTFVREELDYLTNQQKVKYLVFDIKFKSHLIRALRDHHNPKRKGDSK